MMIDRLQVQRCTKIEQLDRNEDRRLVKEVCLRAAMEGEVGRDNNGMCVYVYMCVEERRDTSFTMISSVK
jgi:hypothetical protein